MSRNSRWTVSTESVTAWSLPGKVVKDASTRENDKRIDKSKIV